MSSHIFEYKRELLITDRLAIGALCLAGSILILFSGFSAKYIFFGVINLSASVLIWHIATGVLKSRFLTTLRYLYPAFLVGLFYYEAEMFVHLVYEEGFLFDGLVLSWDYWLFGTHMHLHFHSSFPHPIIAETLHFLYSTYFFILFGSLFWIWKNRPEDFPRFSFVYLATFLSHLLFFIFFPVDGPLDYREELFEGFTLFPAFIDFLLEMGEPETGAFPSSHVGQSVAIYLLLRPMSAGMRTTFFICISGIAVSMVYGSIHYAIDPVAGFISGFLFYFIWNTFYLTLKSR